MLTTNDVATVYHIILFMCGLNDMDKIDLKISRRNMAVEKNLVEQRLSAKDADQKSSNLLGYCVPGNVAGIEQSVGRPVTKGRTNRTDEKLNGLKQAKP